MLTEAERKTIVQCLVDAQGNARRSQGKSKVPEMGAVYEKHISYLAQLVMKVQAMEVKK